MVVVGIVLTPIIYALIYALKQVNIKKIVRFFLNILIIFLSVLYVILSLSLHIEPFNFTIKELGDYFISITVIFVFSPCLWLTLYHYCKNLFRKIRVHKNSKIKKLDHKYFRDDLDKVSPSILMFTSKMDIDTRKCLSATILKLKLTRFLEESNGHLVVTDKDQTNLLGTEKIVLNYIQTNIFDEKQYKTQSLNEALENKYIIKNNSNKIFKIFKILIIALIPVLLIILSINYDEYIFKKYEVYELNDISYFKVKDNKEVDKLIKEVKNKDDFYHSYSSIIEGDAYSYNLIKTDKLQYSFVRKANLIRLSDPMFLVFSIVMVFVSFYMIIDQIKYFNKDYKRTIKGNELLNKAYALKNFLKDLSLMKDKKFDEVELWEYYLAYSVVLDVNTQITDEVIKRYLNNKSSY